MLSESKSKVSKEEEEEDDEDDERPNKAVSSTLSTGECGQHAIVCLSNQSEVNQAN